MKYKYLFLSFSGYYYLPQKFSVFKYNYDSEYIKTHSGTTLTLSWNVKVTDKIPKGKFYLNPLLSNVAGIRGLTIENKKLVWRGQSLKVNGYSPFYGGTLPLYDDVYLGKLYKDALQSIVVI